MLGAIKVSNSLKYYRGDQRSQTCIKNGAAS